MRHAVAAGLIALVTAAPAAAVTGGFGVSAKLHSGRVAVAATRAAADSLRSCQAGDRRTHAGTTPAGETERRAAIVACEQPPRSNLLTPDSVAKATAAALSVLG